MLPLLLPAITMGRFCYDGNCSANPLPVIRMAHGQRNGFWDRTWVCANDWERKVRLDLATLLVDLNRSQGVFVLIAGRGLVIEEYEHQPQERRAGQKARQGCEPQIRSRLQPVPATNGTSP